MQTSIKDKKALLESKDEATSQMLHKTLRFTASSSHNLFCLVFHRVVSTSYKAEGKVKIIHSLGLDKKMWYKMKNT